MHHHALDTIHEKDAVKHPRIPQPTQVEWMSLTTSINRRMTHIQVQAQALRYHETTKDDMLKLIVTALLVKHIYPTGQDSTYN